MFEHIRADYRAHDRRLSAQGFWVMLVYRYGRWRYGIAPRVIRLPFSALYHVLYKLVQVLTGIELPCEVVVGRNFVIDHFGGIVIHGDVRMGNDCRLRNGVVIGIKRPGEAGVPVLGDGVDVGAGAKLLGPIRIGNRVCIGANAVVLCDVPDDAIAVGVPVRCARSV